MGRNMKYPNRTKYNDQLGEGAACLFNPDYNICVTVQWNGKKYLITHAWIEPSIDKVHKMMDYPFIHSSGDSTKVFGIVQTNCDHDWDYYPKHAYCLLCGAYKEGDFKANILPKALIKRAVQEGSLSIGEAKEIENRVLETTEASKEKTCAYRMRTFKLDDNKNTIITSNWMCLLENGEFFRQRCKKKRRDNCQYSN
jgi:hypothetical protein